MIITGDIAMDGECGRYIPMLLTPEEVMAEQVISELLRIAMVTSSETAVQSLLKRDIRLWNGTVIKGAWCYTIEKTAGGNYYGRYGFDRIIDIKGKDVYERI